MVVSHSWKSFIATNMSALQLSKTPLYKSTLYTCIKRRAVENREVVLAFRWQLSSYWHAIECTAQIEKINIHPKVALGSVGPRISSQSYDGRPMHALYQNHKNKHP